MLMESLQPFRKQKRISDKNLSLSRKIRGYAILAKGDMPIAISEEEFLVPSQSSDKNYKVTNISGWNCECPDFQNRHADCKHIHAIKLWIKLRAKPEIEELEIDTNEEKCVYCNSLNIVRNGSRKTAIENKQRFKCKDCGKRFVLDPVKKIKGNGKIVTLTMDLYFKGLSLRDISDTLYQFYNLRVHFDTIRRWINKYTQIMDDYTKQFKPELSDKWHIDEQMVKSRKEWVWCWNVLDSETRFLIANNVTRGREITDARKVLRIAKENIKENPKEIVTDGLWSYERAIRKEFVTKRTSPNAVLHSRNAGIAKKILNNNKVERYHNEFREFDKVRRGFKSDETAQQWNAAFRLYHNFIKKHMALNGTTPSQIADIDIELGRNRWLSLLKQSLNHPNTTKKEVLLK